MGRVNAKLEGWKESLLSKGGKEILLKSVVQAIPQYAMSIFRIPTSICRSIEQKVARFWWQKDSTKAGIHWKSWPVLKRSKQSGGLGFRDLQDFNKAMLGKQAWRLVQNPTALWSTLFKGLYFHSTDFNHAKRGSRPSWGWRSILVGRESILPHLRWSVGNGQSIQVKQDRWLPRGVIGGLANRNDPLFVTELMDLDSHNWNVPLLHQHFDDSTVQEILNIQVRPQYTSDRIIWTGTTNGTCSVKKRISYP